MTVFAFGFLSHQLFVYNLSSSYFVESYLNFSGSLDPVVTRNLMDSAVCLQKVQNQRKVLNGLYGQVCGNSDVVISLFGFSFSDKFYHAGVIIEFLLKMTSALISCLFTIRFLDQDALWNPLDFFQVPWKKVEPVEALLEVS